VKPPAGYGAVANFAGSIAQSLSKRLLCAAHRATTRRTGECCRAYRIPFLTPPRRRLTPCQGATTVAQFARPYPQYTGLSLAGQGSYDSSYNSLQLTLQRQKSFPLAFSNAIPNYTASFGGGSRPNVVAGCNKSSGLSGSAKLGEWFDTPCFTAPPDFTYGDESRTDPTLRSSGVNNLGLCAVQEDHVWSG
jgi:hypothetical protein